MMSRSIVGVAICFLAVLAACGGATGENNNNKDCQPLVFGMIIYPPAVELQVRDPFGRAQAIGTTAIFRRSEGGTDQGYVEDTLNLVNPSNQTGTFSATVSRPYYRDATVSNIQVVPNGCTVKTAVVPVTLALAPNAPPLRALVLLGADNLYAPGVQVHLVPHFDANPDVSTAVTWTLSDSTLVTVDASGVVTAKCTKGGGTVKVTATAVADGTTSAFVNIGVAGSASCP